MIGHQESLREKMYRVVDLPPEIRKNLDIEPEKIEPSKGFSIATYSQQLVMESEEEKLSAECIQLAKDLHHLALEGLRPHKDANYQRLCWEYLKKITLAVEKEGVFNTLFWFVLFKAGIDILTPPPLQ